MKHNLPLGVILALIATLFYSSLTAINKAFAGPIPLPMLMFMQTLVAFSLFTPVLIKNGARKTIATKRLPLHLMRTVFSLMVSYALFTAVQYIPLTNAMLLTNTAPLIVPFVAYFVLSEKMNHRLWVPIIIGFSGIALVLQPDGKIFDYASLLALASAVFLACTMLSVRRLTSTESSETITFYFFFLSTIISGLVAIKFWVPLTPKFYLVMLLSGICLFLSQYILTYALRNANAQLVSTLLYMNVINAAVISAIFWDTLPTGITVIGILLTIIGGILCIRVEHHRNKRSVVSAPQELHYAQET